MKSTYKKLGPHIREVMYRNTDLEVDLLLGVSISKEFIPSIANTIGTDMSRYKVVRENQFAYGPVTSRNSDKISLALLSEPECIISTSYTVFEIIDHDQLLPEYLMMWFRRPEFDRYARYMSHGSVREMFGWEEMCDVELPVPSIAKQREIVKEYQTVVDRIRLNERLNEKLEEAAQAIYKQWFVEFDFPMTAEYAESIGKPELAGQPYKSSGGEMEYNKILEQEIPKEWKVNHLEELVDKESSITYGVVKPGDLDNDGVRFVRGGDIKDGKVDIPALRTITQAISEQYSRTLLRGGEILMSLVGNPGAVAIAPTSLRGANIARQVGLIRVNESFSTLYVRGFLESRAGKNALTDETSGSVQQVINLGDLRTILVPVPADQVVAAYDSLAGVINKQQQIIAEESACLARTTDILLARMPTLGGKT